MNRISYLLILVPVLAITQSNAQQPEAIGFKVALTSASQTVDYGNTPTYLQGPDINRRLGFNAAVYAEWFKTTGFSFVTQLEYTQRGFTQELRWVSGGTMVEHIDKRNARIDYLSLPLFVKVSPTRWTLAPYLIAGLRMHMRVGASDDRFGASWIEQNYRKTSWGASAGIGLESRSLLPLPILLEVRYNVDAVDLYNVNTVKSRNNAFDFWLGVAL